MATIGAKLELEGAAKFKSDMANATSQTKLFQAQMKNLQSTVGKSTFAKSVEESKLLSKELANLKDKSAVLANQISEASAKYGENSTYVNKLKAQYENLQAQINSVDAELKAHGGTLGAIGAQLQETGAKISEMGKSISGVGDKLTTAVTLPLVAIGTKGVLAFAEVDKTMQLVNATMKTSEEEATLLSNAMKQAAANSTFGMADASQAMLNFARAGLKAEEAAAALAPAMNLAAGEGGELETVSAGLVATINGFGDDFAKAGEYADVFANACNNSALDVNSLSEAMSVAAPIFSAAGYSVEDAALYMGTMANAGIGASEAATALKTGFSRLVKPADEGAKALESLGISITNTDGSMKDTVTIQKELHDAFAGLSESEQLAAASAIFGKNQMSNWLALINTAPEEVNGLADALDKEGTTAEMADAMMSGFGGSLEKLKSSVDVLVTSIGESLAPTIQQVSDKIQEWVDWFNGLSDEERQQIVNIGLMVAAIGPLLSVGGRLVTGIGTVTEYAGKLLSHLPGLSGGIGAVSASALAVAGAIAIWAGAFVHLWNTNEEFRAKITEIWNGVVQTVQGAGETILESINAMGFDFDSLGEAIKAAWDWFCNFLEPMVTQVVANVSRIISSIVTYFTGLFQMITGIIVGFQTGDWSQFLEGLKGMFLGFIEFITAPFVGIWGLFTGYLEHFGTSWSEIWTGIQTAFMTIWETITTFLFERLTAIQESWLMVWQAISDFFTTLWTSIQTFLMTILTTIYSFIITKVNEIRNFWTQGFNAIQLLTDTVITFIKALFESGLQHILETVTTKINAVKDKFTEMKNKITEVIKKLIEDAKQWASDMMDNFINGIKAKIQAVKEAAQSVASAVAEFLHFTEPDKGPLSNFNEFPKHMMQQYAEGIENGRYLVQRAVSDVSADVALMNNGLEADEIYNAVNSGASDANISLVIGERELGRALRDMGVVMA